MQPKSVEGNTSTFSLPVTADDPVILDPEIAVGFEYASKPGSPLFASFIAPSLGEGRDQEFFLELLIDGEWIKVALVSALTAYGFSEPTSSFRLTGIDVEENLDPASDRWLLSMTFDRDGIFEGSVTALTVSAIPEPAQWVSMVAGLTLVIATLARSKRRSIDRRTQSMGQR